MQKLQASKGWQTKLMPDSRALILLGLGPQQAKSDENVVSRGGASAAPKQPSASTLVASGQSGFALNSIE